MYVYIYKCILVLLVPPGGLPASGDTACCAETTCPTACEMQSRSASCRGRLSLVAAQRARTPTARALPAALPALRRATPRGLQLKLQDIRERGSWQLCAAVGEHRVGAAPCSTCSEEGGQPAAHSCWAVLGLGQAMVRPKSAAAAKGPNLGHTKRWTSPPA